MQTISITKQDWIAIVKITRPKVNAMNHLFFQEFQQAFSELKFDRDVRAVCLLSGLPNVFTAGLDLKQGGMFPGSGGNDAAREAMQFINMVTQMQQAFTSMEQCSKPVVVGVNGACIGGGIDLITAADIRYCSSDAVFSIREVDVGIAADLGTLQRLPRIVKNDSWVRECCLTGRDFGANEAFQFGLVSKVFSSLSELHNEAINTTKLIARKSPIATLGTKHLLNYSRDHSVEDGLRFSAVWNSVMLNSKDTLTAAQASFGGPDPVFPKL